MEKKNKIREITLPNFRAFFFYKATVIKIVWYWQKDISTNGTESSPQINPYKYGHLIFNEKRKFSGKSIVFSTNIERTVGYSYDKMDFNLHLRLIKTK